MNRKATPTQETAFQRKDLALLNLVDLLQLSDEEFRNRFQGAPIMRAKRVGLQRNACVALGNRGDPAATPMLGVALNQGEPLVRGHAAWALGRIGTPEARQILKDALDRESSPEVREEIESALGKE